MVSQSDRHGARDPASILLCGVICVRFSTGVDSAADGGVWRVCECDHGADSERALLFNGVYLITAACFVGDVLAVSVCAGAPCRLGLQWEAEAI